MKSDEIVKCSWVHTMEMVTLMPKLPVSANNWAMVVSKTRQSEFRIAEDTPSWILLGVASQVRRRRCPLSSNLNRILPVIRQH